MHPLVKECLIVLGVGIPIAIIILRTLFKNIVVRLKFQIASQSSQ